MKRAISFLALFFLVAAIGSVSADTSEYYVKTAYITKVYNHQLGYKIVYRTGSGSLSEFYIPHKWFSSTAGKGELVYGTEASYPYFSVFWKNGEFHHIRLYLQENYTDLSWGNLRKDKDYTDEFNVETLNLKW